MGLTMEKLLRLVLHCHGKGILLGDSLSWQLRLSHGLRWQIHWRKNLRRKALRKVRRKVWRKVRRTVLRKVLRKVLRRALMAFIGMLRSHGVQILGEVWKCEKL